MKIRMLIVCETEQELASLPVELALPSGLAVEFSQTAAQHDVDISAFTPAP